MLGLADALHHLSGAEVKTALDELAERKAAADPAQADEYRSEAAHLLGQFEALSANADVLFYAAHAFYAADNPGTDPADVSKASPQNAAFLANVRGASPEGAARFEGLMRAGLRGEGVGAAIATKAAMASLKASAATLSRTDLVRGFGAESQAHAARAVRWYLTKTDPNHGYVT